MRKWNRIFAIPAVLLLVVFLSTNLLAGQEADKPSSGSPIPKSDASTSLSMTSFRAE